MTIPLIYAAAVFTSAFLLFQVQPLISKAILPWFGGTPAVWTTCMLFFQSALLAGYAYAHFLRERLRPSWQVAAHLAGIAIAVVLLPILPGQEWKPASPQYPMWRILLLLVVSVGMPYFVLSATAPLLQAWYSLTKSSRQPYRLYAVSNAGSLLALLSYPFLVQPRFAIPNQAWLWSGGFIVFALLCAGAGFSVVYNKQNEAPAPAENDGTLEKELPSFGWLDRFLWLMLSACPSVLLLAFTNYMSRDIAAVPFLWVLPLCIYLVTFIICFDNERWYWRPAFLPGLGLALGALYYLLHYPGAVSIFWHIVAASCVLFICAMACHGELVRRKPHPRYLTSFYMYVSAGGAVGGIFVAIIAPMIFSGYYELHTGLIACVALVAFAVLYDRDIAERLSDRRWRASACVGAAAVLAVAVGFGGAAFSRESTVMYQHRNFYGVLKLKNYEPSSVWGSGKLSLVHDGMMHGFQYQSLPRRLEPVSYFSQDSGIGRLMHEYRSEQSMHVGVMGLGIGTLAAYGRAGDRYRFYEINPEVIRLARTYFSYLEDSPATCEVVRGDARLSLEEESPQDFDILVMDAFRGDAIPVHLVTKEAFALYLEHLKPGGVLAVNISNRHLDLWPLMNTLAREFDLSTAVIDSSSDEPGASSARWVLLSSDASLLQSSSIQEVAENPSPDETVRIWTDHYSSVFSVLR